MIHTPDIENGFIVNATENENSWTTGIQCVLANMDSGERFYLGQQCRMENVPIIDLSKSIRKNDKPFEFLTFSNKGRFFQIPSPDTIVTGDILEDHPLIEINGSIFLRPVSSPTWRSRVTCGEGKIEYVDEEDVYERLNANGVPIRALFLKVRFTLNGVDYEIISPCKYLNFGNKQKTDTRYLQPMIGYVLYPITDFLVHAYFAIAHHVGGRHHTSEFVLPRYTNAFDRLSMIVGDDEISNEFKRLSEVHAVYTRVFDVALPVEAQIRYFTYR